MIVQQLVVTPVFSQERVPKAFLSKPINIDFYAITMISTVHI